MKTLTKQQVENAKGLVCTTEEVKAIFNGKTQFREVVKAKIEDFSNGYYNINMSDDEFIIVGVGLDEEEILDFIIENVEPKHKVGKILFIQESYECFRDIISSKTHCLYRADCADDSVADFKRAETMQKEHSRIWLEVVDIRVERLQDIRTKDILKNGIADKDEYLVLGQLSKYYKYLEDKFIEKWDSKHEDGQKWSDNPYVIVETREQLTF